MRSRDLKRRELDPRFCKGASDPWIWIYLNRLICRVIGVTDEC
jgi:hypothetical protein